MSDTAPGGLAGRRILVTRAAAQAAGLVARLEAAGAEAVTVPLLATEPAPRDALARAVGALVRPVPPDDAVFTSANAVEAVWAGLDAAGLDSGCLRRLRVVAVGPATAAALTARGVAPDLVPDAFRADAAAEAMVAGGVDRRRVWFPRAAGGREVLPDRLRAAGAEVEVVPVYRTVLAEGASARLRAALAAGPLDAVTLTSGSAAGFLRRALDGAGLPAGCLVACIGPVTAERARLEGFAPVAEAAAATGEALVALLVERLGPAPAGRADSGRQPLL